MPLLPPGFYRKTRGIIRRGLAADRPSPDTVLEGTIYFSSDTSVLERSDGSAAWQTYSASAYTPPTYTQGSVLFAGNTGAPTQDNTNLFFDDSGNQLKVGASVLTPKVIGGTGVTDGLSLQSTNGNGTSRTDYVKFLVGNNGAQDAGRLINNAGAGFLLLNETALKYTGLASAKGGIELHVETDVNFATTPSIDVPNGIAFQAYNDAVGANVGFEFRGQPIGFTIGLSVFTQHFARASTLTPSALASGNNDDYNPSGLGGETSAGAYCLRLTGNADDTSTITGIEGGLNYSLGGRELLCVNVGGFLVTVNHDDANSAADNRILLPTGAAIIFNTNDSFVLWYDINNSRWRMVSVCR